MFIGAMFVFVFHQLKHHPSIIIASTSSSASKVEDKDAQIKDLNLSIQELEDKLTSSKEEIVILNQHVERLQADLTMVREEKGKALEETRSVESSLKASQMNLTSANQKHSIEVCIGLRCIVHSSHQVFDEVTNQITNFISPIFLF